MLKLCKFSYQTYAHIEAQTKKHKAGDVEENQPECQTPNYNKHHHQISPRCLTHCTTKHCGQLNIQHTIIRQLTHVVVVYPLLLPLFVGGVRSSYFWSTSQLIPPIWPAAPSLQQGLSTNPGVTMWCLCG